MMPPIPVGTSVIVLTTKKTGTVVGPLYTRPKEAHCPSCKCHNDPEVMSGWYEVQMDGWWRRRNESTYYADRRESDQDEPVFAGLHQSELEVQFMKELVL